MANACGARDESPCFNLGRGKQGYAIRRAGTDLRVVRLQYESEMTVELITVSITLDCESGCRISRASGKDTGRLSVSIVCKGVEFCGRKRVVSRENNEHASGLSKAVWQAGMKGNIIEDAPKQSSASRGATELASRLVRRRIVRHGSPLLHWHRGRIEGYVTCRANKGRTYQFSEEVLGRTPGV